MRVSFTLFRYIGVQFFASIAYTLLALASIGLLIDVIELIRRASDRDAPFAALLQMALLKSPAQMEKILPFAVLIGSMLALTRLTRTHELIVARAAGVSVWQFLTPAIAVVFTLGVFMVCVFNPIAAVSLLSFEQLEGKYLTGKPSLLALSPSGIWLRQTEKNDPVHSEHIIYAQKLVQSDMSLSRIIVLTFDREGNFIERNDAARAVLDQGTLNLKEVTTSKPGQPSVSRESLSIPTTLQLTHIQDSFASPETLPFWSLPGFITLLEQAGFSGLRHRLHWHSLLSSPLLLTGMLLVAAVFSLRLPRRGKVGMLVVAGVVTGFLLYFFTDIVQALGAAGSVPIPLAAWAPALIVMISGTAMLLHLEDG